MTEPRTAAGRKFIEDHGTGKQREVLAIEAEAVTELRAAVEALRQALALADSMLHSGEAPKGHAEGVIHTALNEARALLAGDKAEAPRKAPFWGAAPGTAWCDWPEEHDLELERDPDAELPPHPHGPAGHLFSRVLLTEVGDKAEAPLDD